MKKLAIAAVVVVLAACGTKNDQTPAVDTTMTSTTTTMSTDTTAMAHDTGMVKTDTTMARDTAKTK